MSKPPTILVELTNSFLGYFAREPVLAAVQVARLQQRATDEDVARVEGMLVAIKEPVAQDHWFSKFKLTYDQIACLHEHAGLAAGRWREEADGLWPEEGREYVRFKATVAENAHERLAFYLKNFEVWQMLDWFTEQREMM